MKRPINVPLYAPTIDVVAHNMGNCNGCPSVKTHHIDEDVAPATVCRTCTFSTGNRMQNYSPVERRALRSKGFSEADLRCNPEEIQVHSRVLNNRNRAPISTDGEVGDYSLNKATAANLDSCGWSGLQKCYTCVRFRPTEVITYFELWSGGPIDTWPVTVGGHCSIPPEGIEVDGEVVFCDPKPKIKYANLGSPSCQSCEYTQTFGNNWIIDELSMTVGQLDSTNYEKAQVRAWADPDEPIWKAYNAARADKAAFSFYVLEPAVAESSSDPAKPRAMVRRGVPTGRYVYYDNITIVERHSRVVEVATHLKNHLGHDICPKHSVSKTTTTTVAEQTTTNCDAVRNGWLMVGRFVYQPELEDNAIEAKCYSMFGRISDAELAEAKDALRYEAWRKEYSKTSTIPAQELRTTTVSEICVPQIEQLEVIDGYTIRLPGRVSEVTVVLDDPSIYEIFEVGNRAVLKVLQPHHRTLGLPNWSNTIPRLFGPGLGYHYEYPEGETNDYERRRRAKFVWDELAPMSRPLRSVAPSNSVLHEGMLVDNTNCGACTQTMACIYHRGLCPYCDHEVGLACYWHAMVPELVVGFDSLTRQTWSDYVLHNPRGHHYDPVERNPARVLRVIRTNGVCQVVDRAGREPHMLIFRSQRKWLKERANLRWGKIGAAQVEAQYLAGLSSLPPGRPVAANNGGRTWIGVEPYKPYCTLNMAEPDKGINFRDAWGDRFGIGRSSVEFSNSVDRILDQEEWYRTHSPGARELEERRITARTLEDSGIERSAPVDGDAYFGSVNWQQPKVLQVGATRVELIDNAFSTQDYMDWLNTPITMFESDELVDRRWALFGYRFRRQMAGESRESAELGIEFNFDDRDPEDATAAYVCDRNAAHRRTPGTFDAYNPICSHVGEEHPLDPRTNRPLEFCGPYCEVTSDDDEREDCGGTMFWREPTAGEHAVPNRLKVGTGQLMEVAMSRHYRTQRLLEGMVCEHWNKAGTRKQVGLAEVGYGPRPSEPEAPTNKVVIGDVLEGSTDGAKSPSFIHLRRPTLAHLHPVVPHGQMIVHSSSELGKKLIGQTRGNSVRWSDESGTEHRFHILVIHRGLAL